MTVHELVEALSELPPDLRVVRYECEGEPPGLPEIWSVEDICTTGGEAVVLIN